MESAAKSQSLSRTWKKVKIAKHTRYSEKKLLKQVYRNYTIYIYIYIYPPYRQVTLLVTSASLRSILATQIHRGC